MSMVLRKAAEGTAAIELIDREKPDLIFLDVQMPEVDGFSVIEGISHSPHV